MSASDREEDQEELMLIGHIGQLAATEAVLRRLLAKADIRVDVMVVHIDEPRYRPIERGVDVDTPSSVLDRRPRTHPTSPMASYRSKRGRR